MSKIYGFFGGSHSASTSLVVDGEIKYCIEEERMVRIKAGDMPESYPTFSYKKIEDLSGISKDSVDHCVFVKPICEGWTSRFLNRPYDVVDHHVAHNYGAYFTSGMEGKVISVSYDGGGEESVMRVYLCEDGKMIQVHQQLLSTHGSLSHLWGFSTSAIKGYDKNWEGIWRMCKDEGKLMGMAPEGHYDPTIQKYLRSIIKYENLNFYPSKTDTKTKLMMDVLYKKGFFDTQEKKELYSHNLQQYTNELMTKFFNDLHERFPDYKKIVVSGGLFANVKMNQKINELPWVDELYVYPPMGDEGLSLGACLWKAVQLGEITKPLKLSNISFGSKYSEDQISKILTENSFDFERKIFSPEELSKDIHEGLIIGWFQDGMEYGPRALGNRSILVRPTEYETHQKLNERLGRYDTMPFAPMILDEYFDEVFTENKSKYSSKFMTICYTTKDEWIEKMPAVIQKSDKTARPQIINQEDNSTIHSLMKSYYDLSDIPVLLNTSFNIHGEPIIENPFQALTHLKNKVIDKLVLGDYVYQSK
jgi:carbamoyltransferase